jgi:PAS domain S-box-containing protein
MKVKDKIREQIINTLVGIDICDSIGDGISIQDTDYKILYENNIHKEIFGDHVGKYCYEAYQQKNNVCKDCPLSISFKDNKTHVAERSATINSEKRHFEITSSPLRNSTGKIIAGIEVLREITDRVAAIKALKESENRFKTFSEESFEGIVITEKGKFVDANRVFLRLFGYTLDEIRGKEVINLVAPEDRKLVESRIMSEYDKSYVHNALHKNGSIIYVEVCGKSIKYQGRKCRITALRDITERKESKKELNDRVAELEKFYELAIGREIKMKQLKEENKKLKAKLSQYEK